MTRSRQVCSPCSRSWPSCRGRTLLKRSNAGFGRQQRCCPQWCCWPPHFRAPPRGMNACWWGGSGPGVASAADRTLPPHPLVRIGVARCHAAHTWGCHAPAEHRLVLVRRDDLWPLAVPCRPNRSAVGRSHQPRRTSTPHLLPGQCPLPPRGQHGRVDPLGHRRIAGSSAWPSCPWAPQPHRVRGTYAHAVASSSDRRSTERYPFRRPGHRADLDVVANRSTMAGIWAQMDL